MFVRVVLRWRVDSAWYSAVDDAPTNSDTKHAGFSMWTEGMNASRAENRGKLH